MNKSVSTTLINVDELNKFIESNPIAIVGLFDSLENKYIQIFNSIIAQLSNDTNVHFAISTEQDLFKELNLKKSQNLILFNKKERNNFTCQFDNEKEILKFINNNQTI